MKHFFCRITVTEPDGTIRPCLVPANDAAADGMGKIPYGEAVRVEITRPRNIDHHRKFFALLQKVYENQDTYKSVDELLDAFKMATGRFDWIPAPGGKGAFPRMQSISFAKMDQVQFELFYNEALDIVAKRFLPGVETDALRREVEGFM